MFKDKASIEAKINEKFPSDIAEIVIKHVYNTLSLMPDNNSSEFTPAPNTNYIGGTPYLSTESSWPIRPIPEDLATIVDAGGMHHSTHIHEHLSQELPYQFALQISLPSLSKQLLTEQLPSKGRLLFFFDAPCLPWNDGASSCVVLHDTTPDEQLSRQPKPDSLAGLEEKYLEELKFIENIKSPYIGDCRDLSVMSCWKIPYFHQLPDDLREMLESLEIERDTESGLENVDGEDLWEELTDEGMASFTQLLGTADAEQSDPAYSVACTVLFGSVHIKSEDYVKNIENIKKEANNWQLLLQLYQPEWMNDDGEGTIYFMIRKADLVEHNFNDVVAIYQQT